MTPDDTPQTITWLARFWNWVDDRDIDKHVLSVLILLGTKVVTDWAMLYASMHADRPGLDVAAVIAAVTAPYMALQAAAIKFHFNARSAP